MPAMFPSHLPLTSERGRRHFLRIGAAAVAMMPFIASKKAAAQSACSPTQTHCCLLRDTRILTDHGSVPVENLAIGDLVLTRGGDFKHIKWIGKTSFKKASQAQWHESIWPIRVARSAIDTNVPSRDLYLSRAHALFMDGYLIPVEHLVNGRSITLCAPPRLDVIEYFHLEFENHEVIYADGAAVESLFATDGRESFVNFVEYERLYGSISTGPKVPYAPVLGYNGGRQDVVALLRLAVSPWIDTRDPIQIVYDRLVARAKFLDADQPAMSH
jgi:hypothetical protein